jgi:hypothetical protein
MQCKMATPRTFSSGHSVVEHRRDVECEDTTDVCRVADIYEQDQTVALTNTFKIGAVSVE